MYPAYLLPQSMTIGKHPCGPGDRSAYQVPSTRRHSPLNTRISAFPYLIEALKGPLGIRSYERHDNLSCIV